MRKFVFTLFGLALAISACQPAVPATPTQPAAPTDTPPPTQAAIQSPETTPQLVSGPGCTVVSTFPTPSPVDENPFLPISQDEWIHGSPTGSLTIIEYGDFQ